MHDFLPITAYQACCACGMTVADVMTRVFEPREVMKPDPDRYPTESYLGPLPGDLEPLPEALVAYEARQARMGMHVVRAIESEIREAISRWGEDRVAVLVGTSTGGLLATEKAFPSSPGELLKIRVMEQHAHVAVAGLVADYLEISGPAFAVSTACSSSAKIFGTAQRLIRLGTIDAAIAIGVDTLCQVTVRGFAGLGLLAKSQCRPFDAERDGINIGEAAAAFLVERESTEAEFGIYGLGEFSGAHHMTLPHAEGAGASRAMRDALQRAGIAASEIGAVYAHGTATPANDRSEAFAISDVFGSDTPVFGTKGLTGHTLGACGALEAAIALGILDRGRVPRTFGVENPDPSLSVNLVREDEPLEGDFVLSNSLAFGDDNASLILGRA